MEEMTMQTANITLQDHGIKVTNAHVFFRHHLDFETILKCL